MKKTKQGVIKRAIITPDKHAPIHDKAAINVVKQAIELVKPEILSLIHISEPTRLGMISYAVFCLKKKK